MGDGPYCLFKDTTDSLTREWLKDPKKLLKAELAIAEVAARKGKRKTRDTHGVEVYLDENLDRLAEALYNYEWKPGRGAAHIIFRPVQREIFAAPYEDRLVHHWVIDTLNPWLEPRLYHGSSSCRVGKGTSFGIKLLDTHIRRASHNFAIPVYVIKLDISGYFMHIVRSLLLERVLKHLDAQFKGDYGKRYKMMKYTIEQIVMDEPIDGVTIQGSYADWRGLPESKSLFAAEKGRGIVIGNLPSQVFSNVYLDALDRFVTLDLGYKYYGRYVDDFYIVVTEEQLERAKRDIRAIGHFLNGIGLSLNKKKIRVIPAWQGVPFLGMVNRKGAIIPDKRIVRNYTMAVNDYIAGVPNAASVESYIGMLKNYNSWKVINGVLEKVEYRIKL